AVLDGHVHHLADLLREDLGQAAAEDREILREDEHTPAEDRSVARHDGVAPRPALAHLELDLAVAYVAVELDERARIEQLLEPLASEQLALRALALDVRLGRLVLALLAELREALQLGARAVLGRRHKGSLAPSEEERVTNEPFAGRACRKVPPVTGAPW